MSIVIEKAVRSDKEELLTVQKLAYQTEAELYNDYTIAPLCERLFVHPDYRRKGYSRLLMMEIEREIFSKRYQLFT